MRGLGVGGNKDHDDNKVLNTLGTTEIIQRMCN